jgi:hypothetical protein
MAFESSPPSCPPAQCNRRQGPRRQNSLFPQLCVAEALLQQEWLRNLGLPSPHVIGQNCTVGLVGWEYCILTNPVPIWLQGRSSIPKRQPEMARLPPHTRSTCRAGVSHGKKQAGPCSQPQCIGAGIPWAGYQNTELCSSSQQIDLIWRRAHTNSY